MTKPNDVPQDVVEAFLSAIDKIDPFGRDDLDMSPQQYRRYRVRVGLHAAIMAEREACAQVADNARYTTFMQWDQEGREPVTVAVPYREEIAVAIRNRS